MFVQSVNCMQQLLEDIFATCLVPEAEQLCQLNEARIWVSVLELPGNCIFAFGDHFFFDSHQKVFWNYFNFDPCDIV